MESRRYRRKETDLPRNHIERMQNDREDRVRPKINEDKTPPKIQYMKWTKSGIEDLVLRVELLLELGDFSLLCRGKVLGVVPAHISAFSTALTPPKKKKKRKDGDGDSNKTKRKKILCRGSTTTDQARSSRPVRSRPVDHDRNSQGRLGC